MRNYQYHKNNPYWLPHNVYMQVLYAVRDYDRLRAEYLNIINETPSPDGVPGNPNPGDSTAQKAVRALSISNEIDHIERALEKIPQEYRMGVFNNVRYRVNFPVNVPAHRNTWSNWRRRFLYFVAKNKKLA